MPIATLAAAANRSPFGTKQVTRGSGRRQVVYRDAAGKFWDAKVISAGSASGLLLEVVGIGRFDNVAVATAMKQNSRYYTRLP
jgi:hypothetical protein